MSVKLILVQNLLFHYQRVKKISNSNQRCIEKLDFNLSQFQTLSDLIAAFHKVRDLALEGKIPLVFLDEFDSAFDENIESWPEILADSNF